MAKSLLIVERDPSCRFAAALSLHRAGYQTTKAGDTHEALMLITQKNATGDSFDLVLADLSSFDNSDIFFLSKVKGRNRSIPVCAFSESRDRGLLDELIGIGCDGIISKPFEPDKLVRVVDDIFKASP